MELTERWSTVAIIGVTMSVFYNLQSSAWWMMAIPLAISIYNAVRYQVRKATRPKTASASAIPDLSPHTHGEGRLIKAPTRVSIEGVEYIVSDDI